MSFPRICAVVLILAASATVRGAADTLPSAADLQSLADAKDWPGLLGATTRVLTLKGQAAAGFDRVDVWMKKAEAQLQSKQFVPASQSFVKAAEEKTAQPQQSDLAKTMSRLAKKTDAKGYRTPARQGAIQTFDVLDPAKRPEAMAAMLEAEIAELTQRITQQKAATDAKPMIEVARQITDLRAVDRVVNKSSEKTDALEKAVVGQYVDAVKKWSDTASTRLDALKAKAEEKINDQSRDRYGRLTLRQRRQGLMANEKSEVQKIRDRAEDLAGSCTAVTAMLGDAGKTTMKPAESVIQSAYDRADTLLTAESRVFAN